MESDLVQSQPTIEVLPPKKEEDADDTAIMRGKLFEHVEKNFDDIISGQVELAKGVYIKEYVRDKKTGKMIMDPASGRPVTKVYLKPPDREAGRYLLDQVVGKPKETTVVEGRVKFEMDV